MYVCMYMYVLYSGKSWWELCLAKFDFQTEKKMVVELKFGNGQLHKKELHHIFTNLVPCTEIFG